MSSGKERDHQDLHGDGRPEHGGPVHPPQEECDEEQAEHQGVEDRADDVDGLDEVFGQAGEERKADRDQTPQGGEAFGGGT